jgi:DNA-directed RNA polymerase subunit N (RpoN/RPB10)
MDKVINPISKKPITIGGGVFNKLIADGYVLKNGILVYEEEEEYEEKQPYVSSSEEEIESETESGEYAYDSDESDVNDELSEEDVMGKKKKINYESSEEYDEYVNEGNNNYQYSSFAGSTRPAFAYRDTEIESYDLPMVRCIECNKPISYLHKQYVSMKNKGMDNMDIYKQLNLNRPCCRMNITHTPKQYYGETDYDNQVKDITKKTKNIKLTRNPILEKPINKNTTEIIRLYKNDQFEGIKEKVKFGKNNEFVDYRDFKKPELLQKRPLGKYYVSYVGNK